MFILWQLYYFKASNDSVLQPLLLQQNLLWANLIFILLRLQLQLQLQSRLFNCVHPLAVLLCKGFEQLCSLATSATTGIRLSRATLHLVQASSSSTEEDAIFFGRSVKLKSSHSTSINTFQIWCSATTLSFYSTIAYLQLTFSQHYSLQSFSAR